MANAYLELGNIPAVCARLKVDESEVSETLAKREVKGYIDQVYLDTGYRNRFKLAEALDDLIERKMEEAETARQEQIARMKEKTEELAYKNQMKRQQREKDLLWNQTHNVSQHRLIR